MVMLPNPPPMPRLQATSLALRCGVELVCQMWSGQSWRCNSRESTDADSKLKRTSNDAFAQCISSNNGCLREKTDGTNAVLLSTIKCILLYGKNIFRFLKTKSLTQQIHETDSKAGNGNTVKEFQTVPSHRSQLSKIWPAMSMKTHGAMVVLIGQLQL